MKGIRRDHGQVTEGRAQRESEGDLGKDASA